MELEEQFKLSGHGFTEAYRFIGDWLEYVPSEISQEIETDFSWCSNTCIPKKESNGVTGKSRRFFRLEKLCFFRCSRLQLKHHLTFHMAVRVNTFTHGIQIETLMIR